MSLFGRIGKGTPFDWLVVGLGNPGQKYAGSRHNVGEQTVTLLAQRWGTALKAGRDNALVAEARFADERVVLAFPITFMNDSGQAVGALVRRYRIETPDRISSRLCVDKLVATAAKGRQQSSIRHCAPYWSASARSKAL